MEELKKLLEDQARAFEEFKKMCVFTIPFVYSKY